MRASGFANRLISWIACLAILMGAIAPAITHSLQRSSGNDWIEVCTSLGAQFIQSGDTADGHSVPGKNGDQGPHCPYCSPHLSTLALPPAIAVALLIAPVPFPLPVLLREAPRPASSWPTAQSRAPPPGF
jgi:hypothetical protein